MTSNPGDMNPQDFIRRLLSPERIENLDPFSILTRLPIGPRDTVADIGCGPGYFTVPLAKALVSGKVYAVDLDQDMLDACRVTVVDQARMGNVEFLKCDEFTFPLPERSLDGAFMAFVVHASPDKPRFLSAVKELLRPGSWCAVLEWYRKETEDGPPLERRIDPDDLLEVASSCGFRSINWRDINGDQYMMNLRA